jgi:hypothetical protein
MLKNIEAFMIILLITWVCASTTLGLAFWSVVQQEFPRRQEQMTVVGRD